MKRVIAFVIWVSLAVNLAEAVKAAPTRKRTTEADTSLKVALDAARWIRASAIRTDEGTMWPADPVDPKTVSI